MRGKALTATGCAVVDRITPAYAGKSPVIAAGEATHKDHPRLCGEKSDRSATCFFKSGSPPPMRGKENFSSELHLCFRITPAYAGKSHVFPCSHALKKDHPRLCGEKTS